MPINAANLALNVLVDGTTATTRKVVYSATNGVAQLDQVTAYNDSGAGITIHFYIKTDTTTTGTLQEICRETVGANSSAIITKLVGHKIPDGGSLQAHETAGTDGYVTVSGAEIR